MKKNLIFTGGIFHPFDETSKTLSKIINSFGYESEITIDIETGIKNINEFDLITFNALRWRMLNHEKYIPYIDEWQFSLSDESRNLLEDFIKKGGKIVKHDMELTGFMESAGESQGHYFHQDLLVANQIFLNSPERHIDIGSRIDGFVARVAAFREIEIPLLIISSAT